LFDYLRRQTRSLDKRIELGNEHFIDHSVCLVPLKGIGVHG
jgi:hypothetical protein